MRNMTELAHPRREIEALTGIRGIAASWVVIYHLHEFDKIDGPLAVLLRHGYLAVDLFFVLSGFVMALSYARLFSSGFSLRNYGVYLIRRIARIYPLYFVLTLACGYLLFHHMDGSVSWKNAITDLGLNLTLIDSWGIGRPLDGPSWSVSTECAAYLLFPWLVRISVFGRRKYVLLLAISAMTVVMLLPILPTPPAYRFPRMGPLDIGWDKSVWPMVRCIAEFSIGLIAFRAAQVPSIRHLLSRQMLANSIGIGLFLLLLVKGTDVVIVGMFSLLLLTLTWGVGAAARLASSPPILFLGHISYAVYLVHFPLLRLRHFGTTHFQSILGQVWTPVAAAALFYGAVLILSWASFSLIEVPGRRLIRKLEERLFPREASDVESGKLRSIESTHGVLS